MKNYKELMDIWSEEMYERLSQAQKQIGEASRADYHKGYAEGISAGISYAMAIMHRTERQLNAKVNAIAEQAPEATKEARLAPYRNIPATTSTEPVIKRVIAWKCGGCGDSAIVFQDPNQPVLCTKCGHVHKFKQLYKASYFCDCGKICKFMIQDDVTEVECHCCKKIHRMRFSDINGDYYSLDNRERQGYTPRRTTPINSIEHSKAKEEDKKEQKKPTVKHKYSDAISQKPKDMTYDNHCLACDMPFVSDIEHETLCPDCTGGN